jgi:omega-6 fatty acid desaturase (delta-12 desaturase)
MNLNTENIQQDRAWEKIILKYTKPDWRKSLWQIINSFVPYVILWYLMFRSLQYSYWLTLLLSLVAAGFAVRLFIIFHDCGHGSFFRSKRLNDIMGKAIGILLFTPYSRWHYNHKIHHSTAGNLDKRGGGDIWTLTVKEYMSATKRERLNYRLYRNPWFMLTFGTVLILGIKNRFSRKQMQQKDKMNIYFTNVMILLVVIGMSMLIGLKAYLLIQIPIIFISHSVGIWLFYVQHQFDDVYWEKGQEWDYKDAAIEGSSFLKLPVVLQWFTGNIGFHHVHHLSPRIPFYNLPRCHYENSMFHDIKPMTILSGLKALNLRLWDDISGRMITFSQMPVLRKV